MQPVTIRQGAGPLILSFPHVGTHVPDAIAAGLNEEGRLLRDTDWHVDTLYDGLVADATMVAARFHRYVIDANRDPSGESLYPGQTTTGLVPLTTFDNVPIWTPGAEPDAGEIERRRAAFHAPYHAALNAEIERVKAAHGYVLLYDCHSIRSVVPWLFEGTLPDFNIGTDHGRSTAAPIEKAALDVCAASERSHVLNGRFRGGWTTRHYGRPDRGVHAIQMELAQSTHLKSEVPPFELDGDAAASLRGELAAILRQIIDAAEALHRAP